MLARKRPSLSRSIIAQYQTLYMRPSRTPYAASEQASGKSRDTPEVDARGQNLTHRSDLAGWLQRTVRTPEGSGGRGRLVDRSLGLRVPPKRFEATARVAPGEFSRPQAAARRAGEPRRGSS